MDTLCLFLFTVKTARRPNIKKEMLKKHIANLEQCLKGFDHRYTIPLEGDLYDYFQEHIKYETDWAKYKLSFVVNIPPKIQFFMKHARDIFMGIKFSGEEYDEEVKDMKNLEMNIELVFPIFFLYFFFGVFSAWIEFSEVMKESIIGKRFK
ncbi:uncharacterized protein VNE69_12152 [Vairimorpha necatrix]|uniref:Uncharacterized protein n=1 Tax=Vairimorpha necatrix TaxID=6039 RepID=A0AAX4JGR2_9MICR